jgi:hypothetical protein
MFRRHAWVPLLLASLLVAACSEEAKPVPEAHSVTTTTAAGATTTVGGTALDAVAARIGAEARTAKLDPKAVTGLRTVMLRAMGFSTEQAACVVGHLPAPAASEPVGAAALLSSIPAETLTACVDPSTFHPKPAPDLASVPPDELRGVVADVLGATLRDSGLTAAETECVSQKTVATLSDSQLVAMVQQPSPAGDTMRSALEGCLTPARVTELSRG